RFRFRGADPGRRGFAVPAQWRAVRLVPRVRRRIRAGRWCGATAVRGRPRGAGRPGPAGRGPGGGRWRRGGRSRVRRDRGIRPRRGPAAAWRLRTGAPPPAEPELMKAATGISAAEFARRRRQLMRMAGDDAILVLPAAPERIRSRDTHYPYRQD